MKTEYKIAQALKVMMATMPLDDISVTTLSKKCHINRQTFYYHFHDIYDLLTLVFLNETIPDVDKCKNIKDIPQCIYKYYEKNSGFIDATINSAAKDLFQEFIYNNCYQIIFKQVNAIKDSKRISLTDRKAVARFYALAYSTSIVYYLSAFKSKSLNGLQSNFIFVKQNTLSIAIADIIESKGEAVKQ